MFVTSAPALLAPSAAIPTSFLFQDLTLLLHDKAIIFGDVLFTVRLLQLALVYLFKGTFEIG